MPAGRGANLPADKELRKDRCLPVDAFGRVRNFFQQYIDNWDACSITSLSNLLGTDPSTLEVEEWKDQLLTGYALWGIPRAPDKSTLGFDAVTLGATLDGYRAQARLGEAKTCDYIGLTWFLLQPCCPKIKDTSMGLG